MKKITKTIALIMTVVCVLLALTSCSKLVEQVKDKISEGLDSYAKGTIEDDVYKNESVGITFTKPSEWQFLSESEMKNLFGSAGESLDAEDFINGDVASLVEMYCSSSSGDNVNITISKGLATQSEEDVMNDMTTQVVEQYKSLGWNASVSEISKKELGKKEYSMCTVEVKANVSGTTVNMKQFVYVAKISFGYVSIACTSVSGIGEGAFKAMFS